MLLFFSFDEIRAMMKPRKHVSVSTKKAMTKIKSTENITASALGFPIIKYAISAGTMTSASNASPSMNTPVILTKRIFDGGIGIESRSSLSFAW